MDSGKLFIEKMNFGIYLVILLTALLNRIFGFFNPYDHEMYVGKFAGVGQIFYLMVSFAVWSHLISLVMIVVGLVTTLKRAIEKESIKNSFRVVTLGTVHTLLIFATLFVIASEFIAVT